GRKYPDELPEAESQLFRETPLQPRIRDFRRLGAQLASGRSDERGEPYDPKGVRVNLTFGFNQVAAGVTSGRRGMDRRLEAMGVRRLPCRRRWWTLFLIAPSLAFVSATAPSSRAQATSKLYQATVIVT